jgi:hypothetical protein
MFPVLCFSCRHRAQLLSSSLIPEPLGRIAPRSQSRPPLSAGLRIRPRYSCPLPRHEIGDTRVQKFPEIRITEAKGEAIQRAVGHAVGLYRGSSRRLFKRSNARFQLHRLDRPTLRLDHGDDDRGFFGRDFADAHRSCHCSEDRGDIPGTSVAARLFCACIFSGTVISLCLRRRRQAHRQERRQLGRKDVATP